ncbi:extracellular solute-binding protein [Halorientalis halophila]|uniref:extracellular solute-binding protein n=1 Tax=Halorientalis halophila TaxID=3108499 RepID=UPI00300A7B12
MAQRSGTPDGAGSTERTRRGFLASAGATGAAALAGCIGGGSGSSDSPGSLLAFHAGSLAPPFGTVESQFESETGIDVTREAKGSVASTKKITEQGRRADVLGVSDFRLIRDSVLGEYGEWLIVFTTNAMSIQYRPDSPGADEIGEDNWWDVLSRDDVTIGHSDPAVDPGGYRAVMAQQLGAEEFEGSRLYDDATYRELRENSTVPTGTETNLEGQLKSGELDYVFYYQSISSSSDLPYVDLQPQVDLSKATTKYAEHYAKAEVETGDATYVGAPIAYGMTVPGVARNPENGARWVEYMITEPGKQVLRDQGLQPVETPTVNAGGESSVPERVMRHAEARENLGPLRLDE